MYFMGAFTLLAGLLSLAFQSIKKVDSYLTFVEIGIFVTTWVVTGKWGLGANLVWELLFAQSLATLLFTVDWVAFLIDKPLSRDNVIRWAVCNIVLCGFSLLTMVYLWKTLGLYKENTGDRVSLIVTLVDVLFNLVVIARATSTN
ncbi:hypothetical protein BOTNAR_0768g00030 [Botryotinia narcissicola]|uniref:MARVEL domain-containing protein n=1 Tax=Botryotinia narcissicola TaxID=278944 RepID=A0A4Z1H6D6_9HELO|nr:hypothetical protein BOTNAR_0768g00030 [Botryotinia narcissicola]